MLVKNNFILNSYNSNFNK